MTIALALSGGGSRAIAFHLGCLRALHRSKVLNTVSIISAVSGGSIIAGLYAYCDESFESFDHRVVELLHRGLNKCVIKHLLSPPIILKIVLTNLFSSPLNLTARAFSHQPPFRRWGSRTDALAAALEELYGKITLNQIARPNLEVLFNACELRTGTAFRFGNRGSGGWRLGHVQDCVSLAQAVACSAAYPLFLPAMDKIYTFINGGLIRKERVILSDGGVYDNLGISCLVPDQYNLLNIHALRPDYIISCNAGQGQFSGERIPYGFISRSEAAFESLFRKAQDAGMYRLHLLKQSGRIKGYILSFLGQQDNALPVAPPDLIPRDTVCRYPTNFSAMSSDMIDRIALRGDQLTSILLSHYCPELASPPERT